MWGFGGRNFWGRRERRKRRGIVVLFTWISIEENHLKDFVDLYASLGWDSLVCHSQFLNFFFPDKAMMLAWDVLSELVEEIKVRPCPVVFAAFSGGSKACLYKALQDNFRCIKDCIVGHIYDSSPVDFVSDMGMRFALHQSVLKMRHPPRFATWIANCIASGIDTLFLNRSESQCEEYWRTLYSSVSMRIPYLLLCSEDDDLAPVQTICNFAQRIQELGADVTLVKWASSPHLGHYHKHPDDYRADVTQLLQKASAVYAQRVVTPTEVFSRASTQLEDHITMPSLSQSHEDSPMDSSTRDESKENVKHLPTNLPTINPHGVLGKILFDMCVPKNVEDWDIRPSSSFCTPPMFPSSTRHSPFNPIKRIRRSRYISNLRRGHFQYSGTAQVEHQERLVSLFPHPSQPIIPINPHFYPLLLGSQSVPIGDTMRSEVGENFPRKPSNGFMKFNFILIILLTNAFTFYFSTFTLRSSITTTAATDPTHDQLTSALLRELNATKNLLFETRSQLIKDITVPELGNAFGPHKLPLGFSPRSRSDVLYSSMGAACFRYPDQLARYMTYDVGSVCPSDDHFAQQLILKGCEPLPRRRCRPKSPVGYMGPTPFPESLWVTPPDTSIVWDPYTCKSYKCLVEREKDPRFFDCKDCFNLKGKEKSRWLVDNGGLNFGIDCVLATRPPGSIRIGLDIGGGTGTFAARMRERNVTIITTSMNLDGPFNSFIASRGLIPIHVSVTERLPFFDNTLDVVHSMHVLSNWIPETLLEFLMYDVYRVLRPGGLFWVDHFFCLGEQLNKTYAPMVGRVGFLRVRWFEGRKLDRGRERNEWYFSALLEKPMT
ncbi:hypothetical protein V2J09_023895 [Rumex salicifolius]